ncbi:MAG: hypothetical protein AAGA55_02965 [Planctomycetota bacterium]
MAKRDRSKAADAVLSEAIDIPASIAKTILTDTYKELPQLCGQIAANGWPAAAILTAAGAPVAAALICLGGVAYVRWRQAVAENKEAEAREAELKEHFARVQGALDELREDQAAGLAMLEDIHSRRRFVWAKLDGNDKQIIADKVTDALRSIGFDGEVTLREIGATLEEIKAAQEKQATKDDLAAMEQRILDKIEENKKSQTDPTQQEWPPELIEQARLLRERGDKEQQAVAEIALRNHEAADAIIQELKKDPIAEAFRILTLEGDNWYQANEPDKALEPYEQALTLCPEDTQARNNATTAYGSARLGDVSKHRLRAIQIAEETLSMLDKGSLNWALTQNNLGVSWRTLPTGDREENTRNAIGAFEAALTVRTKEHYPAKWAMTQTNLGNAWLFLSSGDRADNLRKAIKAYQAALTVRTRNDHPVQWAATQNNLGVAWRNMPDGNPATNLREAIKAYQSALTVRTKEAHPTDWAMTQNNLGVAWRHMPVGNQRTNLQRAADSCRNALRVFTRNAHPTDWASSQNNLAVTLSDMAKLPGQDSCGLNRQSIACSKAALTVRTAEGFPQENEETLQNLAIARKAYEAAGCAEQVPFDDIPPAE